MNKTTRDIPERIWIGPKTIAMLGLADNKQAKNAHEYVCADHIAALERQVAEAQAVIDKLREAAVCLLDKWDRSKDEVQSVFVTAAIHGHRYVGDNVGVEIQNLREAAQAAARGE